MKFSFLQKEPDVSGVCEIIYDISADRAVERIAENRTKADYFLDVLSKPLTSISNIRYRQEILRDLDRCEGLYDDLLLLFTRYDRIKSDWQQMRLSAPQSSEVNPEALLDHSFASLKITSIFPSTIASFFENIRDTLSKYEISSEGLVSVRNWCDGMAENKALDRIVEIAQKFRYGNREDFDFEILVKLKGDLHPEICEITDISEKKQETGGILKLFRSKEQPKSTVLSELSGAGDDPYTNTVSCLNSALRSMDVLMTEITNGLYESFFGISEELSFYGTALRYIRSAREQNVPLCYPEILPPSDDVIDLRGMRELLLLSSGNGEKTVENDLSLRPGEAGLVVKGLTDSGKTVFLRAAGAVQLFAQAGLPVLAESGRLSVRYGLFSHFSSAEEEFLKGSAQGRFDQEAQEISGIIGRFRPYSLLLLNETFQTTSYAEGTRSIYNILRYMPRLNVKYIFVTHLTHLFDYLDGGSAVLAHTSDDPETRYKIITDKQGENK